MARRKKGVASFFDGFAQAYGMTQKVLADADTAAVMEQEVEEDKQFSTDEVTAAMAKGYEWDPKAGLFRKGDATIAPSRSVFRFGDQTFDAKPSDDVVRGLKMQKIANVYRKHGDAKGALEMEAKAQEQMLRSQQAEKNRLDLEREQGLRTAFNDSAALEQGARQYQSDLRGVGGTQGIVTDIKRRMASGELDAETGQAAVAAYERAGRDTSPMNVAEQQYGMVARHDPRTAMMMRRDQKENAREEMLRATFEAYQKDGLAGVVSLYDNYNDGRKARVVTDAKGNSVIESWGQDGKVMRSRPIGKDEELIAVMTAAAQADPKLFGQATQMQIGLGQHRDRMALGYAGIAETRRGREEAARDRRTYQENYFADRAAAREDNAALRRDIAGMNQQWGIAGRLEDGTLVYSSPRKLGVYTAGKDGEPVPFTGDMKQVKALDKPQTGISVERKVVDPKTGAETIYRGPADQMDKQFPGGGFNIDPSALQRPQAAPAAPSQSMQERAIVGRSDRELELLSPHNPFAQAELARRRKAMADSLANPYGGFEASPPDPMQSLYGLR